MTLGAESKNWMMFAETDEKAVLHDSNARVISSFGNRKGGEDTGKGAGGTASTSSSSNSKGGATSSTKGGETAETTATKAPSLPTMAPDLIKERIFAIPCCKSSCWYSL